MRLSDAGQVTVWWFDEPRCRWLQGPKLGGSPAADRAGAVAWAPANGRGVHLVAAAYGDSILVWHLKGSADDLQVRQPCEPRIESDVMPRLPVDDLLALPGCHSEVYNDFNMMGMNKSCGPLSASLRV